ncbi:hypothetical protein FIV00_13040 [Labrenzia sp. THAF82]|uniref:hypothetical protein n=1 Tax=Labrenzia sp. THAF82 TaxID=2587861 RepID=UPI0012694B5E|nr:hypothetical protein [Labrenzia sp. THAF82]QFT31412.1 hypothetical protein FIV00_13040 [Labrenzia sp. THAF82]
MTDSALLILIVPGFFLCFGLLWSLIVFLISRLGGWSRLSRLYPGNRPPPGHSWRWGSASFGLFASYRNCLDITLSNAGIYLRPVIFFRIGHTPILIPWHAIASARRSDLLITKAIRLEIKDPETGATRKLSFYGSNLANAIESGLGMA